MQKAEQLIATISADSKISSSQLFKTLCQL
jgi:hypothetical protein